jgi:diaminopimelate epimerase
VQKQQPGQRMFNPDGTEAETCLNGVRCVARLGFEKAGVERGTLALKSSSVEAALVAPLAQGVVTVRTEVGPVSIAARDVGLMVAGDEIVDTVIPGLPNGRRFTAVALPNPHLIAFVETIDEDELVALGTWCEGAPPLIPGRANVSFVRADADGLYVRTFERGAGLTDSCGSAMGASIHAAGLTGRVPFGRETVVRNRGGLVRAVATGPEAGSRVVIAGNATFEYDATVEVDLAAGTIGVPVVRRDRAEEREAWARVIATIEAG